MNLPTQQEYKQVWTVTVNAGGDGKVQACPAARPGLVTAMSGSAQSRVIYRFAVCLGENVVPYATLDYR